VIEKVPRAGFIYRSGLPVLLSRLEMEQQQNHDAHYVREHQGELGRDLLVLQLDG
jgi:hypothetical protein